MGRLSTNNKNGKCTDRPHYIPEWAKRAGKKRADIARELGVDKGTVTRWFQGVIPQDDNLQRLAALLGAPEKASLFRHPDDDWLARFLIGANPDQKKRAQNILRNSFPDIAR